MHLRNGPFGAVTAKILLQRLACKDALNNSVQEARVAQISQTSVPKPVNDTRRATRPTVIVEPPLHIEKYIKVIVFHIIYGIVKNWATNINVLLI